MAKTPRIAVDVVSAWKDGKFFSTIKCDCWRSKQSRSRLTHSESIEIGPMLQNIPLIAGLGKNSEWPKN